MSVYICRRCNHEGDAPWEGACPGCGGYYRARKVGVDDETGGLTTLGSRGTQYKPKYISTGQPGFDHVMGGGLVAGRTVLLGGYAGAGKTRLLLTIADYIAKTQGTVVYASGEESSEDLNGIGASLGLVNDRVALLGNQSCVEDVIAHVKKIRAFLTIYDSAQEFVSKFAGGTPGSTSQCKAIGKAIKTFCGTTKTIAIVVNQMTGEGGLKGGTELEHQCDTINVLGYPKEDDPDAPGFEDEDYRVLLNANKNRCGVSNLKSYWKMNDAGVLEHVPARSKIVDISTRGKYRRRRDDDQ